MRFTPDSEAFIRDGFIRVAHAFPSDVAEACRRILWARSGCAEDDPATWTSPVIRLDELAHPPFLRAVGSPAMVEAFDALVGRGRWLSTGALGKFALRFPHPDDPGDTGWHVDASFGWEREPDFLRWRVNISSRGRGLVLLMLFSDVGDDDAPTRLRAGSHLDIARRLLPHGHRGLTIGELASTGFSESASRPETLATGPAGTVYVCHPFLVHAAQPHRGRTPRFLAQPPVLTREPLDPFRDGGAASPVERAIRLAVEADLSPPASPSPPRPT